MGFWFGLADEELDYRRVVDWGENCAAGMMSPLRETRVQGRFTLLFVVVDAIFTHPVSVGRIARFLSKRPR